MRQLTESLILTPEDYAMLDEDDFGVPGLVAHEVVGPFVRTRAAGPLIMVHDGFFEPRHGIGHHPHRANERLFYILEGVVDHDDAMNGITGRMRTGDLGILTEGVRGMLHKEWNDTDGPARAFILVYSPNVEPPPAEASFAAVRDADAPRYDEAPGVRTKELLGPGVDAPIHGDIRLFTDSELQPGAALSIDLEPGEGALLFPVEGDLELAEAGRSLPAGHTLLIPPTEGASAERAMAPNGARVLRVVHGPGFGLVAG